MNISERWTQARARRNAYIAYELLRRRQVADALDPLFDGVDVSDECPPQDFDTQPDLDTQPAGPS
jgi:hypothetical protein